VTKLALPGQRLLAPMPWVAGCSQAAVWAIGALDVLGGLGVVVPGGTGILPALTVAAGRSPRARGRALSGIGRWPMIWQCMP
jgi:hypothetical protein